MKEGGQPHAPAGIFPVAIELVTFWAPHPVLIF